MVEWIISSSLLILIVVALRAILKNKISLKLRYALWGLVLVRLLLPVSFGDSALSIQNLTRQAASLPERQTVSETVQPATPQTNHQDAYEPAEPTVSEDEQLGTDIEEAPAEEYEQTVAPVTDEKASLDISVFDVLMVVWLAGVGVVGVTLLVSNLRFYSMLKRTRTPLEMQYCKRPVYVCDELDTPCLFGLFRPAIYVTSEAMKDKTTLRHTIEHETTHYKHRDNVWSLLRGVCLALHWYNPLVWWAAVMSRNDSELACDESTILRLGEWERASYGRTLIGLTCQKRPALLNTATTMTGSGKSIKERISLIVKAPKMATFTLIVVFLIAAVVVGVTFTSAAQVPWYWAENMKAEDIVSANAWKDFEQLPALSDDETAELVRLLNELEEEDFTENSELAGITPTFGLHIETEEAAYTINESGCLEMKYDNKQWWIDSTELREFIEDKAGVEDTSEDMNEDAPEDTVVDEPLDANIPDAAVEYAEDYIHDTLKETLLVYGAGEYYTDAEIEDALEAVEFYIERVNTGSAGLTDGVDMYSVNYAISADGYMQLEAKGNDVPRLADWGGEGTVFLMLYYDLSSGEKTWERCGIVLPQEIEWEYTTTEFINKYGDPYTAAAMEAYRRYNANGTRLMRVVNGIFDSSGDYTLTATDSDGRVDTYTTSVTLTTTNFDVPGTRLIDNYYFTLIDEPDISQLEASEFSLLFEKGDCSFKVYSDDDIIELNDYGHTVYLLAEKVYPEEERDRWYGHSPIFSFFREYAEAARYEYEITSTFVDDSETDYEKIAQSLAEQYVASLSDRPDWYMQRAEEALIEDVRVTEAYYGEEHPNFCFYVGLILKVEKEYLEAWAAGTGLLPPPDGEEFIGYNGWGTTARVERDSDGNWRALSQLHSWGAEVYLPYPLETATAEQLIDTYFNISGFSYARQAKLFSCLLERPAEELQAALAALDEDYREVMVEVILRYLEDNPEHGVWTKEEFMAICG